MSWGAANSPFAYQFFLILSTHLLFIIAVLGIEPKPQAHKFSIPSTHLYMQIFAGSKELVGRQERGLKRQDLP
jgi:hypothetical protein